MSQERGPKALRVVVLIDGAVVDERIVRRRAPLAFGRGGRCELLVPSTDAPVRWPLFGVRRGRWVLTPAPGMQARAAAGDGAPVAVAAEGAHVLAEDARGKLVVGEVTLLFQMVDAPPLAPRPLLPPALRLRLRDRVDPYLAAVVVFSVIAHAGAIGWIAGQDTPRPPEPVEAYEVFTHPLMPLPPPTRIAQLPAGTLPSATNAPDVTPQKQQHSAPTPTQTPTPTKQGARPEVAEGDVRGVLDLLGHAGKDPGRFDDVTGKQAPGGDLTQGIHRVGDQGLTLADARRPSSGLTPGSEIGDGHDLRPQGPDDVLAATRPARGSEDPLGHIDLPHPAPDPGSDRPAEDVYARIKRSYFGMVQKCYESVLKRDAALRGRVDVALTIGERGQVMAVDADGFDASLDTCIEAGARRWHFDAREGDPITFEFPFSFSPAGSSR
jgi:hypothetical protein